MHLGYTASVIAALQGIVINSGQEPVLLKVGQVTLALTMPTVQAAGLRPGDELELHTHLHFSSSADQLKLFGFTSPVARDLFVTLISGSGVGPKVALALLELGVPGLVAAVRDGDEQTLVSVVGVGPKLAKKVILELSEKVAKGFAGVTEDTIYESKRQPVVEDAVGAVVALGFSRVAAEQAMDQFKQDEHGDDPAPLIRKLLASLGPRR